MRPLVLHVSALNDVEYAFYTGALTDLIGDDESQRAGRDYDSLTVGVREARAWIRGRFGSLSTNDIDAVLKLFHPNLGPTDVLTGGQFFAALRLVVHLESGRGLDHALAFVQAHPSDAYASRIPALTIHRRDAQIIPPPATHVSAPNTKRDTNPFSHPYPMTSSASSPAQGPSDAAGNSHNPFLSRARSLNLHNPLSVTLTRGGAGSNERSTPPLLPPRKPPIVPPPRHGSAVSPLKAPSAAVSGTKMSPLMQQSLQASKAGQSMKRAEEMLEKERVMQVLKSSVPSIGRTRSNSPPSSRSGSEEWPPRNASGSNAFVPPLPRRRQPSESSGSLQSYEQVAGARLQRHSPPHLIYAAEGSTKSEGDNSSESPSPSRVNRSMSMHHPSPPPRPPPRHRRPESAQWPTSSPSGEHPARVPPPHHAPPRTVSPSALAKEQMSPLSIAQLQKAFEKFQTKAQPTFDKARYKAEAGLSRRGFVRVGEAGLMENQELEEAESSGSDEGDDGNPRGDKRTNGDVPEWVLEQGWKPL